MEMLRYCCKLDFNPRSRMGSDRPHGHRQEHVPISIHAPAWGATHIDIPRRTIWGFQSTLPHGERRELSGSPSA